MSSPHRLRENADNDIEAIDADGNIVEKLAGWTTDHPFFVFERQVASFAARHNAASFVTADGREGPTIHGFLVEQEDLYDKAIHDLATDVEAEHSHDL